MSKRDEVPKQAQFGLLTAYLARMGYSVAERRRIAGQNPNGRNWRRIGIEVARRMKNNPEAPGKG